MAAVAADTRLLACQSPSPGLHAPLNKVNMAKNILDTFNMEKKKKRKKETALNMEISEISFEAWPLNSVWFLV